MKTHLKKMPISDQPHQPAKPHHLQVGTAETREEAADTQTASTATGVKSGNETDSTDHDSKASASDGEPAALPTALTREQQEVANQFKAKRAQPNCSEVELGLALLDIIHTKSLPMRDGRILRSELLFDLDRFEVRRLVGLAEQHRAGPGGGSPALGADVRPSGSNASKEPPASLPEAADAADRSATPVPIPAPEKKRTRTKSPKAAEAAASQAGEPLEDLVLPPVEATQPGPAEPAPSPPGTFEQPAPVDTAPSAAKPESERQVGVGRAPVQSMAEVAEPLTAGNAGRLRQLEAVIVTFVTATFEAGRAIREIRATKLYLEHFDTFEEYCEVRLCFNRSRGYQLIDAADVKDNLSTQVDTDTSKLTEKHCRELVRLKKPADQRRAWKEAADSADGNVSLVHLKQVVAKLRPPARPLPADKAPATAAPVAGAAEATPDHAVPAETHEEPTTDQPESSPGTAPAAFATDEFDLDAEWLVVEQIITSMFQRCPKYKRQVLWRHLNAYSEQNSELIPAD